MIARLIAELKRNVRELVRSATRTCFSYTETRTEIRNGHVYVTKIRKTGAAARRASEEVRQSITKDLKAVADELEQVERDLRNLFK